MLEFVLPKSGNRTVSSTAVIVVFSKVNNIFKSTVTILSTLDPSVTSFCSLIPH